MKNELGYYSKHGKNYFYYLSEQEKKERAALLKRVLAARRTQEEKDGEQYELHHSQGYCDKCFMLRPLTGVCPTCN